MMGQINSLNASVACGIVAYEACVSVPHENNFYVKIQCIIILAIDHYIRSAIMESFDHFTDEELIKCVQ